MATFFLLLCFRGGDRRWTRCKKETRTLLWPKARNTAVGVRVGGQTAVAFTDRLHFPFSYRKKSHCRESHPSSANLDILFEFYSVEYNIEKVSKSHLKPNAFCYFSLEEEKDFKSFKIVFYLNVFQSLCFLESFPILVLNPFLLARVAWICLVSSRSETLKAEDQLPKVSARDWLKISGITRNMFLHLLFFVIFCISPSIGVDL